MINAYVLYCFSTSKNLSYLCNLMSDWYAVWIKMQHFKWTSDLHWKVKMQIADMWLIPLDHVTYDDGGREQTDLLIGILLICLLKTQSCVIGLNIVQPMFVKFILNNWDNHFVYVVHYSEKKYYRWFYRDWGAKCCKTISKSAKFSVIPFINFYSYIKWTGPLPSNMFCTFSSFHNVVYECYI